MLAFASGKRRSEIHTLVANKVSNLGQWEKVALFPSDFIAKKQLAREGSQSVSPGTIPALNTIVDRQYRRHYPVSGVGPEVLFGPNQGPERFPVLSFHLLQERTYLRHQTRYTLFLVETNHSTLL